MIDPVKLSNLNISTNDNTIDLTNLTTAVPTAVTISSPVATLKFRIFTPHDIKQYLHSILTQMNATNYFSPLLTTDFQSVSQIVAIANPTIDSALNVSLSKSIPPNNLKILAMGDNIKSGVYAIKNLIDRTLTPKYVAQVDSLYLKWCNIRRGSKELLEDYTAKIVQFQSDLKGINCCITNEELVRKWRQGLGNDLASINIAIDDLQIHIPQWISELSMYQLMEEANTYIGKSSLDSANTYIGKISHNSKSTGQKLDTFSSKPSKQDEKDKTADKHKAVKDNLSPKEKSQFTNLPPNFKRVDICL